MDFGTGYASSSAGQKERRRDAGVMQQKIADHVDHDAVKQLQILEYMTAQLRSTHTGITTDQQVVMGQQVHAQHLLLCTSRTCFRCHLSRWL
jgi:hypothetical protein